MMPSFSPIEIFIIWLVLGLVIAGNLYLPFLICFWSLRGVLRSDPSAHPGTCVLLASGILISVALLALVVSQETGWLIFWPAGILGSLFFLGRLIRSSFSGIRSLFQSPKLPIFISPPAIPKIQFWLQDLIVFSFLCGVAFLLVPEHASRYMGGGLISERPSEMAGAVAFWPSAFLPENARWPHEPEERLWWTPFILLMQASALVIALDTARRSAALQKPCPRWAYVLTLQLLALFSGCIPIYGWLIWRYAMRAVRKSLRPEPVMQDAPVS